jgi:hypothetical protein
LQARVNCNTAPKHGLAARVEELGMEPLRAVLRNGKWQVKDDLADAAAWFTLKTTAKDAAGGKHEGAGSVLERARASFGGNPVDSIPRSVKVSRSHIGFNAHASLLQTIAQRVI